MPASTGVSVLLLLLLLLLLLFVPGGCFGLRAWLVSVLPYWWCVCERRGERPEQRTTRTANTNNARKKEKRNSLHHLTAHGLELRGVVVVRAARQLPVVHAGRHAHAPAVDAQDLGARVLVGVRELNLAIQATAAQERRVEDVGAVGGGDDAHVVRRREAVELFCFILFLMFCLLLFFVDLLFSCCLLILCCVLLSERVGRTMALRLRVVVCVRARGRENDHDDGATTPTSGNPRQK